MGLERRDHNSEKQKSSALHSPEHKKSNTLNEDEHFEFNDGACEIPYEGVLEFFFIDSVEDGTNEEDKVSTNHQHSGVPLLHFSLNLTKRDDRGILKTMLTRSRREAGDNIVDVRINGKPLQPPYNCHKTEDQRRLESLHKGVLEFAYATTTLRQEQHWKLDLSVPSDSAIAYKLLESVYTSALQEVANQQKRDESHDQYSPGATQIDEIGDSYKDLHHDEQQSFVEQAMSQNSSMQHSIVKVIAESSQETWTNATLNGKTFHLYEWACDTGHVTEAILRHSAGKLSGHKSHVPSKSVWRVPTSGILEFDSISSHPKAVLSTPYSFDLSIVEDRNDLCDVWTRACSHYGQTLWNATIDGERPIQLPETLLLHPEGEKELMRILPRHGILTLDYINFVFHNRSRRMRRHKFSFDFRPRGNGTRPLNDMAEKEKNVDQDGIDEQKLVQDQDTKPDVKNEVELAQLKRDSNGNSSSEKHLSYQRRRHGASHRAKAVAIVKRTMAAPGSFEFCFNLEIDGEHVPQKKIPRMKIPMHCLLDFEVAAYVEHEPVGHRSFLSICENLASQNTVQQRQLFLECLLHCGEVQKEDTDVAAINNGPQKVLHGDNRIDENRSNIWFLAEQVEVMMLMLDDPQQRWLLLCTVSERILDCVNLVLGVYDSLTSRRHHKRLLQWIQHEVPHLDFPVRVTDDDIASMTMRKK